MALSVAVVMVVSMSGRGRGRGAHVSPLFGLESVGYCLYLLLGVISEASGSMQGQRKFSNKNGKNNRRRREDVQE